MGFDLKFHKVRKPEVRAITTPLPDPSILLTGGCHVDHEGYDLNEIEQAYYINAGISLVSDNTWYKDGGGDRSTNAIIQPWAVQDSIDISEQGQLILDHSMFVFKYPLRGEAQNQIIEYASQRPELLRLISTNFKCGLDLCIDLLGENKVEPIVHIEWDYRSVEDMIDDTNYIQEAISKRNSTSWRETIKAVKSFNAMAAMQGKLNAFQQADFRSMMLFGDIAYKLIPTL